MNLAPSDAAHAGFHGKLPCNGDFVQRRLPADFTNPWDAWLQRVIHASRQHLGDAWLDIYLTSPLWRFALAPGVCGPRAYAGVLAPSVDRVGRYFPIAIVRALDQDESPLAPVLGNQTWFEAAREAALAALESDAQTLEQFDQQVLALAGHRHAAPALLDLEQAATTGELLRPLAALGDLAADTASLAHAALESRLAPVSYWWTEGSDRLGPRWLVLRGLPQEAAFTAMLAGDATAPVAAAADLDDDPTTQPTRLVPAGVSFRSAGLTHPGHVRSINQDAWLARADAAVWAVADGMGGGRDGDRASRMICESLAGLEGPAPLAQQVEQIKQALAGVNQTLVQERDEDRDVCASTAVVLAAEAGRYAVIWAGDSRLYRLRAGKLAQLTRDHSVVEEAMESGNAGDFGDLLMSSNVITRAVGGEEELQLDELFGELEAGDRFLLCSDGVYREIADQEIVAILGKPGDPEDACAVFRELVLSRAAKDNFTVVVVQVD